MSIQPVPVSIPGPTAAPVAPSTGRGAPASGFADAITDSLDSVSQLEFAADAAIQDVASGGDTSVYELMTSTSKAQLGVEVLASVRDKAIEAYQEIMRMQV